MRCGEYFNWQPIQVLCTYFGQWISKLTNNLYTVKILIADFFHPVLVHKVNFCINRSGVAAYEYSPTKGIPRIIIFQRQCTSQYLFPSKKIPPLGLLILYWNNSSNDSKAQAMTSYRGRHVTHQKKLGRIGKPFLALHQKWRWKIYQKLRSMSKKEKIKKVLTDLQMILVKSQVIQQIDVDIVSNISWFQHL